MCLFGLHEYILYANNKERAATLNEEIVNSKMDWDKKKKDPTREDHDMQMYIKYSFNN